MHKQDILDMLNILKQNILSNPLTTQNIEDEFKTVELIVILQDD